MNESQPARLLAEIKANPPNENNVKGTKPLADRVLPATREQLEGFIAANCAILGLHNGQPDKLAMTEHMLILILMLNYHAVIKWAELDPANN